MKLNVEILRYLSKTEFRVLTAIEIAMKNHDLVPVPLIESLADLRRHGLHSILSVLLKHKLIAHDRKVYDGYKLTYLGYDFLALKALMKRGSLVAVGMRMGVGKESDIHICKGENGRILCLKLHRLGRISFRSIKRNRDYLQHRKSASWMYLARLAAVKEYAYMRALYDNGFVVPQPIDVNRHALLMTYVDAYPLAQIKVLRNPYDVLEKLIYLIVRLAQAGLIHCDFNEFNLMISDDEKITLIDFPQIVTTNHPNAEMYFNRDVQCIKSLFYKKYGIEVTEAPSFLDIVNDDHSTLDDVQKKYGSGEATQKGENLTSNHIKIDGCLKEEEETLLLEFYKLSKEARIANVSEEKEEKIVNNGDGEEEGEKEKDEEEENICSKSICLDFSKKLKINEEEKNLFNGEDKSEYKDLKDSLYEEIVEKSINESNYVIKCKKQQEIDEIEEGKSFNNSLIENEEVLSENEEVLSENEEVLSENEEVLNENEEVLSENESESQDNEITLPQQINVLRTKAKRHSRESARKKLKNKKNRSSRGNSGLKKNRDKRNAKEQIKHEW